MASNAVPTVRNLEFAVDEIVPRHWHGGKRAVSIFFDNLSVFFPEGERFFIKSVRRFADVVTDPTLKRDVAAFCGQEGVHTREHVRYNARLAEHGYPVAELESKVTRILARVKRRLPKRRQLAATCALEHFTATLGYFLLRDPRLLDDAHPAMASLWRFHAAEEIEHRHVAFDVFRAAGGTYGERVTAMFLASVIFWAKIAEHQVKLMRADGCLYSLEEWASLFEYLFVNPGGLQDLFPIYLRYYKPSFHPMDEAFEGVLAGWLAQHSTTSS